MKEQVLGTTEHFHPLGRETQGGKKSNSTFQYKTADKSSCNTIPVIW
jgi:hypothetical protein